jgi:hypothetical protein
MQSKQPIHVLHVFNKQIKFSRGYFRFLKDYGVDLAVHFVYHYGKASAAFDELGVRSVFASYFSPIEGIRLLMLMFRAERIVIHSLASPWILLYLYLFPALNRKVFWVVWGKDLYFFRLLEKPRFYHRIYEHFRKRVFPGIGHLVVIFEEEYDLARQWYGVTGVCIECNMLYPYAVDLDPLTLAPGDVPATGGYRVIVGNSASETNNHVQVFETLKRRLGEVSCVICPLSYGGEARYTAQVDDEGKRLLGDKFEPLQEFIDLEAYLELLNSVQFAIYGYDRQEGLGNIITLIRYGVTVYMKAGTSTWKFFKRQGIEVLDLDDLRERPLSRLSFEVRVSNSKRIAEVFSPDKSVRIWKNVFGAPVK